MDCLFVDFLLEASGPIWIGPDSRQVHVVKNTELRSLISVEINVFSVAQDRGLQRPTRAEDVFCVIELKRGRTGGRLYNLVAVLRGAQVRSY